MPDFHDVKLVDISILLWITTLNLENRRTLIRLLRYSVPAAYAMRRFSERKYSGLWILSATTTVISWVMPASRRSA